MVLSQPVVQQASFLGWSPPPSGLTGSRWAPSLMLLGCKGEDEIRTSTSCPSSLLLHCAFSLPGAAAALEPGGWGSLRVVLRQSEVAGLRSSLSLGILHILSSRLAVSWNWSHSRFWCQVFFHLLLLLFLYTPCSIISWISVCFASFFVLFPALLLDLFFIFCLPSHGWIFICLF